MERVHVSGWDTAGPVDENQAWNWVIGELGSRSRRRSPPSCSVRRNCAAWPGAGEDEEGALGVGAPEGATGGILLVLGEG